MSFAKIAEARAVKKIVALIRKRATVFHEANAIAALEGVADDIEDGEWKDIKLPPAPEKKKAKKR